MEEPSRRCAVLLPRAEGNTVWETRPERQDCAPSGECGRAMKQNVRASAVLARNSPDRTSRIRDASQISIVCALSQLLVMAVGEWHMFGTESKRLVHTVCGWLGACNLVHTFFTASSIHGLYSFMVGNNAATGSGGERARAPDGERSGGEQLQLLVSCCRGQLAGVREDCWRWID